MVQQRYSNWLAQAVIAVAWVIVALLVVAVTASAASSVVPSVTYPLGLVIGVAVMLLFYFAARKELAWV